MKLSVNIAMLSFLALAACTGKSAGKEQSKGSDIEFTDKDGRKLDVYDLERAAAANVNYAIEEGKTILPEAKALHDEARSLGQAGKYDEAIAKLQQAMQVQPDWAYPVYDMAFSYLLKGDAEHALKYYRKTDEMEPKGFFTAKTAVYALEGEALGKFPKGMYLSYIQIEWTEEKAEKLKIAKAIAGKTPTFAPAWKEMAGLLEDPAARLDAVERGLAQNPDPETKGMLLLNKAIVLSEMNKQEEAKKLLEDMIAAPESTRGSLALAKTTLQLMNAAAK